jgi:hypothetical protein
MEENNKQPIPVPPTKIVETYAEDMAEVIKSNQGSLIKTIIHEEEAREIEKENISPDAKRNKLFAFFGSVFVLCSVALVGFFIIKQRPNTVEVQTPFNSMIFNDATGFIEIADFDKDQIIQSIRKEVETKDVKVGGLDGIYLTSAKNIIGLRAFLNLMESDFTITDDEAIDDNFLMGFVNEGTPGVVETDRDFFILIKVNSFTEVFGIMREWENKMFQDLHGLFGVDLSPETAELLTKNFENGIVQNKNARILYHTDAEGKSQAVLMYVFADDTHLLITKNENTVREVITRLLGNNLQN